MPGRIGNAPVRNAPAEQLKVRALGALEHHGLECVTAFRQHDLTGSEGTGADDVVDQLIACDHRHPRGVGHNRLPALARDPQGSPVIAVEADLVDPVSTNVQ